MTQPEKPKRKPTELNDFEQLTQIGHGAFGKVYRAVHKQARKAFALKKISKKEVKAQNMITQLNNEIKISRQLDHPNIIKLYDTFDDGQNIYLVLQLAQNGQLFSKICREGKLDEKTAKQMIKEVLEAVSYLHSRDPAIIHRDIKPQNILLDKTNHVKLADFGWSNFLNKPRKTYCGTFDYLAPEMIDKSGHNDKLDIWCLGVLAYELLTGKTPFVVEASNNQSKQENKKIMESHILGANIKFPNDFPIPAKSFILGMIKRNPQERLTLKQIMNHEWLTSTSYEKPIQLQQIMPKKVHKQIPLIDVGQESQIIASLNNRIRQLQNELSTKQINEKSVADQTKGIVENAQYSSLMKELRKLRGIQQKNIQLQQDNEKYWAEINKRDKQIIELKAQMKTMEENQQSIDKLKSDKKSLQDKIKKLERDMEKLEIKNSELSSELAGINVSLAGRIAKGEKIALSEINSEQYINLIQNQMETLTRSFEQTKKTLQKVLSRDKTNKEKEDELIKLRAEKTRLKEELKAELKENFEEQKDQIIMDARNELAQEKEKWLTERAQLKKFYEEQAQNPSSKGPNLKEQLQLQVKTLRQLTSFHESTINELKIRLRELEQDSKRKK